MILVVLVALVPLAVSTLTTLRIYERAHRASLEDLFRASADQGVTEVRTRLDQVAGSLRVLAGQTIQWNALSKAERDGAVSLVYQQFDDVLIATLVDESGAGLSTSYVDRTAAAETLAAHPRMDADALPEFAERIPFTASRTAGVAFGETYLVPGDPAPVLPIAVRVAGPGKDFWVVAVGLSLRTVCREVERGASAVERFLIDAEGRVLCGPVDVKRLDPLDAGLVEAAMKTPGGVSSYRDAKGSDVLSAVSRLPWGWHVLVRQDAAVAFAAGRRMKAQSALWIVVGLAVAVGTGWLLSRGTNRAIAGLAHGARELEKGNLAYRLPTGTDEFGRLAATFNEMSVQIQKRDAEITGWNQDLTRRVEERTKDLEEAQGELLQTHKQAAMGALGAGMAHEINNPLTSVLGVAMLLEADAKEKGDTDLAATIAIQIEQAKRIQVIVQDLLRAGQETGPTDLVDVNGVIDQALGAVRADLTAQGIELVARIAPGLPPVLGRAAELRGVVSQLVANARIAVKRAKAPRIVVTSELFSGKLVRVTVEDNGIGIAPENLERIFEPFFTTKGDWNGKGLGLSTAFRTVHAHHGSIKATSTPGVATVLAMTFPVARKGTTLE